MKRSYRWLLPTGLYIAVLLSQTVLPIEGAHAHARAYLREFHGATPRHVARDVVLNVLAFVPLGWLLARSARALGSEPATAMLAAVQLGVAFSLSIETVQYFIATRYSSLLDVLANGAGALVGATLAWRQPRHS